MTHNSHTQQSKTERGLGHSVNHAVQGKIPPAKFKAGCTDGLTAVGVGNGRTVKDTKRGPGEG